MNRQQRRRMEKKNRKIKKPMYKTMTKEERMDALVKNGITPEDLKNDWKRGFEAGFREASPAVIRTVYAAVLLAAHESLGFGQKRCVSLLNAVDRHVTNSLCSQEAIDEVYNRLGLTLNFDDPTEDTVQIDEEDKKWSE